MFVEESKKAISQGMTIEGLKCILECTVCLYIPTSTPVHRCNNGHIVCHVCRPKLLKETCPVCRIKLGNLRCLTSEKIISDMPIDCSFLNQGCMVKLPKEPMKLHERGCSFSMINCSDIVVTCELKVPLLQLSNHIMKEHHDLSKYIDDEMFVGMVVELQQGVRGEKSKIWTWRINNELQKSCHFTKRGCNVKRPKVCLSQHERECDKSILNCSTLVHGCDEKTSLLKLRIHLQTTHREIFDLQNGLRLSGIESFDKYKWTWDWKPLKSLFFNGQMFFPTSFRLNNNVHFWVYILQIDEVAKAYGCEITLSGMESEDKIVFKGQCVHSVFDSRESVINEKVHFSTSLLSIDSVARSSPTNYGKELRYTFELFKVPKCFKNERLFK